MTETDRGAIEGKLRDLIARASKITVPSPQGAQKSLNEAAERILEAQDRIEHARQELASWQASLEPCRDPVSSDEAVREATGAADAAEVTMGRIDELMAKAGNCSERIAMRTDNPRKRGGPVTGKARRTARAMRRGER